MVRMEEKQKTHGHWLCLQFAPVASAGGFSFKITTGLGQGSFLVGG